MNEWDRLRLAAAMNKERYPPGTRIELIHMGEDDPNPIPDGTRGTVTAVDDIGTVFCDFDPSSAISITADLSGSHTERTASGD